jgi:hypothetical protein
MKVVSSSSRYVMGDVLVVSSPAAIRRGPGFTWILLHQAAMPA